METDVQNAQLTAFDLARASGARRGVRHKRRKPVVIIPRRISIVRQTTTMAHAPRAKSKCPKRRTKYIACAVRNPNIDLSAAAYNINLKARAHERVLVSAQRKTLNLNTQICQADIDFITNTQGPLFWLRRETKAASFHILALTHMRSDTQASHYI
jgi:hypothetical protein